MILLVVWVGERCRPLSDWGRESKQNLLKNKKMKFSFASAFGGMKRHSKFQTARNSQSMHIYSILSHGGRHSNCPFFGRNPAGILRFSPSVFVFICMYTTYIEISCGFTTCIIIIIIIIIIIMCGHVSCSSSFSSCFIRITSQSWSTMFIYVYNIYIYIYIITYTLFRPLFPCLLRMLP